MANITLTEEKFLAHVKQGWLTVPQAARKWKVTVLTVRAWIKQGKLITVSDMMFRHHLIDPKQAKPGHSAN